MGRIDFEWGTTDPRSRRGNRSERGSRALLAALLLCGGVPAFAEEAVSPIAFTERTLANGLRVYAIQDTTTPNVSIQVWYDVGARDDPRGRSGFAHLFEHLMFKATRNLVPEQFDRLTEDVGGSNNASTSDDYTEYHETVPANHLQRLLFAEADRMANLVVDPASFVSERAVVEEEVRQRIAAQPYGRLFSVDVPAASYARHPYARSVLGDVPNLQAATIDDARAFHATYYRPDNAILVVSGNFDPRALDGWVDRYFAVIARPSTPVPRVTVVEPPRTRPASYIVYQPNTPLPAVVLSYQVPPDRAADVPALTVLHAILSVGDDSRLYRSLVYRDGLAQAAAANLDTRQGAGTLVAYAIMAGGKDAAAGEAALKREIALLRNRPVDAAELAKAKNQIAAAALRSRETAEGRARIIAAAAIVDGDPRDADRQLAAIARVTIADVQRVARTYLAEDRAVAIRSLALETKPADAATGTIAIAPTVVTGALRAPASVSIVEPATAATRVPLPPIAAPVKADVPQPVETRLANGMPLIVVERHGLPLVTAMLVSRGGAADAGVPAGVSALSATLLTKGTATRSATDIARTIESLGGSIGSAADRDGATLGVTVGSGRIAPAMDLLADVVRHPAFAPAEIARARAQAVDAVGVALGNPAQVAALAAARAVFGAHPYGAPMGGTPASLGAITRDDLTRHYRRSWTPASTTLVMVGDITPAAATALADARFADWPAPAGGAAPDRAPASPLPAPRVVVVDMPDAGQAGVVVARAGIARADPRYYPLRLANTILGGGFSSRLNQAIRIERGLAYGAASSVEAGRGPGLIAARTQTRNDAAAEVVELIVGQMTAIGAAPAAAAEIETRKAVLVGRFGDAIETNDGLAGLIADHVEGGVPTTELQRFVDRVQAIDARAEQDAAALLDPAAASIVVAGDARRFLPALRSRYPQVEVISAGSLDLDRIALH